MTDDGLEGLPDGETPLGATLAQPRALAVTAEDALRVRRRRLLHPAHPGPPGGSMRTLVGHGTVDGLTADGDAPFVRMQHPLGLAASSDGALHVADPYNGRLQQWQAGRRRTQMPATFAQPAAVAALPGHRPLVADRGRHCAAIPLRRGSDRIVVELRVACGDGVATRERRAAQPVDVIVT